MNDWRIDGDKIRSALANNSGGEQLTSTDRLRQLGYQTPGMDQADADARHHHRDDLLLARSRRLPPEPQDVAS